jgi:hypothetical protein
MKKFFFLVILSLFLVFHAAAQDNADLTSTSFDMTGFPQWSKDLRRGEIVAFGSFPFALFTTTFIMDTYRWNAEASLDWSEEGRRYAPWPFKSNGAIDMSNSDREMTFITAAGLSAALALTDFIIIQIKRNKERRRGENLPSGTAIITRKPYPDVGQESGETPDALDVSPR